MEDPKPQSLTKDQVGLLKITFRAFDTQKLGDRFYNKLFSEYPQLRPMFTSNMEDQITKIISVFELVIFSFEERTFNKFDLQESVIIPLRELGKKHTQKGVEPYHYPIANRLLLESIKEEAGEFLNDEGLEAWKLALQHLSFAMQNPAVQVAPNTSKSLRESFAFIKKLLKNT